MLWTIQPTKLLCPWNCPGKNTIVSCHSLHQGMFLTQGLNPDLLHCRLILHCLSHQGLTMMNTMVTSTPAIFFFLKIFWCGPFLKSLLNLSQFCFCFMFWLFDPEACGILVPQPGIYPTTPALEGDVLTTGPPGKSLTILFYTSLSFDFFSCVLDQVSCLGIQYVEN